jgi:hypothetical protein
MAFGSGKKIEALEEENARLQQWVAHLQGTDAVTLAAEVDAARAQLAALQQQAAQAQAAVQAARGEEAAARAQLAENLDEAVMHEAGLYTFSHRLENAVAYKAALTEAQTRMKDMVRAGKAIDATTNWSVNNSAAQGRKMVKDISTLMLRAYNAEADSLVRTLRPHSLPAAKSRLDKAAFAIERLGKMMDIRISPDYHRLRYYELELTADYLLKKEQEKEAERERRAELRDQQKAAAEMKAALEKLSKEKAHYANLLAKLDPTTDADAYAKAQAKLAEIDDSITGVEQRAANIRTGHVYVISNVGAFGPDMVKIGMTRRLDPYDRVVELGDASVPFRFDVHAMVFHEDAVTLETQLHQRLSEKKVNRVNPRREFFYATPSEVRQLLAEVAGAHLVEYNERPEALEWHASGSVARDTPPPADDDRDIIADLDDASGEVLYEESGPSSATSELRDVDDDSDLDDIGQTTAPSADSAGIVDAVAVEPEGEPLTDGSRTATTVELADGDPAAPRSADTASESAAGATLPPPNWYPDPHGTHRLRFWDGKRWTDHVAE